MSEIAELRFLFLHIGQAWGLTADKELADRLGGGKAYVRSRNPLITEYEIAIPRFLAQTEPTDEPVDNPAFTEAVALIEARAA